MRRIDNSTSVASIPSIPAAGTVGYFTDGDPATGQDATDVPAWWLNMIQGCLDYMVTQNGLTPSKTDWTQLYQAIAAQIASTAASPTWLTSKQGVLGSGGATVWTSVDCSAAVPAGTKAVIVEGILETDGTLYAPDLYVRQDSTNAAEQIIRSIGGNFSILVDPYMQFVVGLDSARTFDYKLVKNQGGSPTVSIGIVGYM